MDKNSLVAKKKNAAGKKGKKKWASKLDATELVDNIEKLNNDRLTKEKAEKNSSSLGFSIDIEPENEKQAKKELAKDRFKKKNFEKVMSKTLLRKIEKRSTKIEEIKSQQQKALEELKQTDLDARNYDETNMWSDSKKSSRKNSTASQDLDPLLEIKKPAKNKQNINVKRVVLPSDGVSYNPSAKAHKQLIQEAIEQEEQRDGLIIRHSETKKDQRELLNAQNKKRKRAKSLKVKIEQDLADARKKEKALNHQFLNIKNIKKEVEKEFKEQREKRELKKQQEELEQIQQEQTGVIGDRKAKKISNKKYQYQKEYVAEEDIPENLRNINQNATLVRDQFDSVYRRGMLEQRTFQKSNHRKNKVNARRAYGKGRDMTEDDDWMNEKSDVLPSTQKKSNLKMKN